MIDTATMKRALDLADKAKECLERSRVFIQEKIVKSPDRKWGADKLLNGSVRHHEKGLYGTACALSALAHCGEPPSSEYIQNCVSLVLSDAFRVGGGWATSTIKRECQVPMVNATCYVLNALLDVGTDPSAPEIGPGIEWLKQARNPSKRWGHFPGDRTTRLSATCNAIATIARVAQAGGGLPLDEFAEAMQWLRRQQSTQTGGWPKNDPEPGPTALAILALSPTSVNASVIGRGASFLLGRADDWETWTEASRIPKAGGGTLEEKYHIFAEGLVVSALLAAKVDPCSEEILRGVERLIRSQEPYWGYWRDGEGNILSWEVMYGCRAFRDFIAATKSCMLAAVEAAPSAEIAASLRQLEERIVQLESQPPAGLTAQAGVQQLAERIARLERWTPGYWLGRLGRHWSFPLWVSLAGIAVYVVVYVRWLGPTLFPGKNPLVPLIAGGFLGAFFGLMGVVRGLRKG